MMKKLVRISEKDLQGLLRFLEEGTPRTMSMSSVKETPNNIKMRVSGKDSMSESNISKDRIEFKVKGKPLNINDLNKLRDTEPSIPSTDELIDIFHEEFLAERPYLSEEEKTELEQISKFLKYFAKGLSETLEEEVNEENDEDKELREELQSVLEGNENAEGCVVRALTPDGIKTIGKMENGKIVPCTDEELELISKMDIESTLERELDIDSLAAFNDICEYEEEDEEESTLINIYEAAEMMVNHSWAYSINGDIELYKDKDGKVTMSLQADDVDIFSELFDADPITELAIEEEDIYPIGSEALSKVHKEDPNTKFTFFLEGVDAETASQFNGDIPRTLSEILTYAYLASNNNAAIYNEVMNNMVLKKA